MIRAIRTPGAVVRSRPRLILLIGFTALVALRIPTVWLHGRLWAEEGVVYLASAWNTPWYIGLVTVHTGYMNLPASGAATLAVHLAPLEYAPLVTMVVALLIQILPAVLLAVSGISWLRDWRMLTLALLLIALPPFGEEVWVNTITSQFHIMLAVAIILASPPGSGLVRWFQGLILLLAPLSGPGGVMLSPLFFLRARSDRSLPRLLQALLLLPGVLVQLWLVVTHPEAARTMGLNIAVVLAAITGKQILLPLLGPRAAMRLMRDLPAGFGAGHMPVLAVLAPIVVFGSIGAAAWRSNNAETRWIFAASIVILVISYLAALTPGGPFELVMVNFGNRYYVAPAALTGLTVVGLAATGRPIVRRAAWVAVAWLMLVGASNYTHVERMMSRGPEWRREVAQWRADPTRPIAIWPAGWTVILAPPSQ